MGLYEVAGTESGEFAGFFERIRKIDEREAFEAGAEGAFGLAGAVGDAAQFAVIASEEADNEVGLAKGVGAEDVCFARRALRALRYRV